MKRLQLLVGIALLGAVLVGGVHLVVTGRGDTARSTTESTAQVPDFSLPDATGRQVVLSQVDAPLKIVNFWASWSPYSREELPALARLQQEYKGQVAVVALNRDTVPADGRAFLASLGLGDALVFAYDANDEYFKEVGGYNMPETMFVDRNGMILAHIHGPMEYNTMKAHVDRLLSEL